MSDSDSSPYEATQLLARLTVLERVVGMMVQRVCQGKQGAAGHSCLR